ANLYKVHLEKAILWRANLEGANLAKANLEAAILWKAKLVGVLDLTVDQLSQARTIYGAELDKSLRIEIERIFPHILQKPKQ
ncbi:MAG: pentapeptide repeat-containing protein, partial [Deltaproteobacteria bacterium]|nr:pentapeptide repeat-containing protein [Deltaproteobacteria bacterium]